LTTAANAVDAVLKAGFVAGRDDSCAFVIGSEMKKPAQAAARAGSILRFITAQAARSCRTVRLF